MGTTVLQEFDALRSRVAEISKERDVARDLLRKLWANWHQREDMSPVITEIGKELGIYQTGHLEVSGIEITPEDREVARVVAEGGLSPDEFDRSCLGEEVLTHHLEAIERLAQCFARYRVACVAAAQAARTL